MRSKPILFLVAAVVVGGAAGSCYKWPASRSVRYRTNEVESDQDAQDAPQGPASRSVMQPGAQIVRGKAIYHGRDAKTAEGPEVSTYDSRSSHGG